MTSNNDERDYPAPSHPIATQGDGQLNTAVPPNDDLLVAETPGPGDWGKAWTVPVGIAWDEVVANYQQGWEEDAIGDRPWSVVEPGYRYGHQMAVDARFAGRTWSDAEPELRRDYAEWCRRHGYEYDEGSWEYVRGNTRQAWDRAQSGS